MYKKHCPWLPSTNTKNICPEWDLNLCRFREWNIKTDLTWLVNLLKLPFLTQNNIFEENLTTFFELS